MTELSARPTGTIKVAQIGTGNVGRHALTQLITDSRFELTGVWVSSDSKAGKDAAELAGLDNSTGIAATSDLDEVLATNPDCAVYTAMADNRLPDALEDYRRRQGGQLEPVRQRHRPRLRQRPASARAGRHLPEHRADPLHGDRRLRHLRQRHCHV
jgi:hypothetical protein